VLPGVIRAAAETRTCTAEVAHDYARRAVRHRAKSWPDEWTETIAEWRDRIGDLPRRTPAGRKIAICPATYSNATCKSCGACAKPREAVIGFPAHGAWRVVEKATAARDVSPGQSWAFHHHRTMAEVIADEKYATEIRRSTRSADFGISRSSTRPHIRCTASRCGGQPRFGPSRISSSSGKSNGRASMPDNGP
jgi:hypothetical protein